MQFSPVQCLKEHSKLAFESGKATPLFIIVALIAIGIGLYVQTGQKQNSSQLELQKAILLPQTKDLGTVDFLDHNNENFGLSQLQGKWSILFFGFTNCPDICPSTMQTLKLVKQRVEEAGAWGKYQVVMVSVDPERDTVERLNSYVPYFDPEFIGIRAGVEHTTAFAKNVGILFFKGETLDNGGYDVDHGASLILVNPQGEYAGVISAPHKVEQISADLIALAISEGGVVTAGTNANASVQEAAEVETEAARTKQSITFDSAWIRPAPPGATSMAAYFEVRNDSSEDIVIVDSDSPAFEMTMVHETVIENEVASMRHLDTLTIPAGETVSFAPLGTHMMLIGPKKPLTLGDTAELTLIDQNGNRYTQVVSVRQIEQP